ncbi:MAG: S9 family peptidase [Planctomycetota bacterium]
MLMTRFAAVVPVVACAFAASAGEGLTPSSIEPYLKIRTPGAPQLAADGRSYFTDWPDGIFQLYMREAGAPIDGPATKLTHFDDGVSSFSISPDGSMILVQASVGGSEQDDLFLISEPGPGAEVVPLKGDPRVVYSSQFWLDDSSGFVYTANEASPSDFHLYTFDIASGESEKVLAEPGYWYAEGISPDGAHMMVGRYFSASSAEVYEIDLQTGDKRDITVRDASGKAFANFPAGYAPDGTRFTVVDDEDGIRKMFAMDAESMSRTKPLPAAIADLEIGGAVTNQDKSLLAVSVNRDGFGEMYAFALPGFEPIELPEIEPGIVTPVDIEGTTLVYSINNARSPGLGFALDLSDPSKAPVPMNVAQDQGFDLRSFVLPELVTYRAFDGAEIPAFVYLPEDADGPVPFVINFHGGPEAQSRPGFSRVRQYLVENGYGVMLPNVRGSTGYGRAFHEMDNAELRWNSVKDGVDAAEWLVREGLALPGQIAVWGGSYGGFMASATPIEDSRRSDASQSRPPHIGAAINMVGIVNFQTFLEQTKDYRRALREVEYGSLSNPEFLASVSPINFIDDIRVPMMIGHGLNDPRVPVGEAMQLAVGLQQRGLDPELLYFPDEGHGLAKLENRLLFYGRMVRFLDRTIGE